MIYHLSYSLKVSPMKNQYSLENSFVFYWFVTRLLACEKVFWRLTAGFVGVGHICNNLNKYLILHHDEFCSRVMWTWLSHAYHMPITWLSHGLYMVLKCNTHGFHVSMRWTFSLLCAMYSDFLPRLTY